MDTSEYCKWSAQHRIRLFSDKVSQGHDWGGPGDRPDPSQGFVHNKVERCFKLALLRRHLLFLTSTTMGRSAWRSWRRSWPGTTFIPRGILNSPKKQSKYWLLVQNSHKYIYQGGASRHDQQSRQEQKWLNWFGGEDLNVPSTVSLWGWNFIVSFLSSLWFQFLF